MKHSRAVKFRAGNKLKSHDVLSSYKKVKCYIISSDIKMNQVNEAPMELDDGNGYVLYTGGAKGIDALAEEQGVHHGMNVCITLSPMQERSRFITPLTLQQLKEAEPYVQKANVTLKRNIHQGTVNFGLLQRNYWIIKDANYVFAFGEFDSGFQKTTLQGCTGWSVQMALDQGNKVVYVFDKTTHHWYQPSWGKKCDKNRQWYTQHEFVPCCPPSLGLKSAIVGTENPTQEMQEALKSLFERTFVALKQLKTCFQRFHF